MPSIYLYLQSSDYCSSGRAVPVHWRLQMFQLALNVHCSLIYQDVTKNVIWWNYGQLVFEGRDCFINISVRVLVTLRTYLDGDTAVCFHWSEHYPSSLICYSTIQELPDWSYSQMCLVFIKLLPHMYNFFNFVSPLNAPKSLVLSPHSIAPNSSSSVSTLEKKCPCQTTLYCCQ